MGQLYGVRAELMEARKSEASAVEDAQVMQSQLSAAHAEVDEVQKAGGSSLLPGTRAELETAWEALVGPGLERLRSALVAAGLRVSGMPPSTGAFHARRPAVIATDAPVGQSVDSRRMSKRPSRDGEMEVGRKRKEREERIEKNEKKDKSDKKDKKER